VVRVKNALQLGVVAVAVAAAVAPIRPSLVERWYSVGVYPRIQQFVTPLSNVFPFALFDLLVAVAVVAVVWTIGRGVVRARRARRGGPALGALRDLGVAAAVVYLLFLLLWGMNYRRTPMVERLVADPASAQTDAVTALGMRAVGEMNRLHAAAHRSGWPGNEWQNDGLRKAFAETQRLLADGAPAVPGRLKWTAFGIYFRWSGVDGMVNPLALEVLGNPDLLPWERPFVIAHEWSHLAGYAHEAEANFVGWLTCLRGDAVAQYSGWMYLYWQIASEVPHRDRARLAAALSAGPRRDLDAIAERLLRGQFPVLRRASWAVYDQYLRANRVESGVRSYGEVVNLIVRTHFEEGWVPVRRHPGHDR
jgi:hypothetical protein